MNILMLSWRDLKNPLHGGAEVVTDVYLSGLAKKGHSVTLFCSAVKGAKKTEMINGYKVIRKGGRLSVYFHGFNYARKHAGEFDIIIDQINTIPFFTPLIIPKEKRVAFFHQLCLDVWFYETVFPISLIGICSEWLYLKLYHNTRSFVVSDSTKKDVSKYCMLNPKKILVLENQIGFKPVDSISKKENAFCFVGRLKKSKRVHDCIKALAYVPSSKLYIIGDGDADYKEYLFKLVKKLNLEKRIIFTGKIGFSERNQIMGKSLAILVTSVREGWGLIVTEANANGTIAITYDIPGLRDANRTGFICTKNEPQELAKNMLLIANNKKLLLEKKMRSFEFAKKHSDWNMQIEGLENWLKN